MISRIILEGPDCVGKTTITKLILQKSNYKYDVFDRGDISDCVYNQMYGNLRKNMLKRLNWKFTKYYVIIRTPAKAEYIAKSKGEKFDKDNYAKQCKLFCEWVDKLRNNYNIKLIFPDNIMSSSEIADIILSNVENENKANHTITANLNYYKKMYWEGAKKFDLPFWSDGSQIFINYLPIADDIWLDCFGYLAKWDDVCELNSSLIFLAGYNIDFHYSLESISNWYKRPYDVVYIINSKIKRRPQIVDYFSALNAKPKLNVLTSEKLRKKLFGEEYLIATSKAKASIYIGEDLIKFNALTPRLYESLYVGNILFIDERFDTNVYWFKCFGEKAKRFKELLTINPKNCHSKIANVINNKNLSRIILKYQFNFIKSLYNNWIKQRRVYAKY